MTTTTSENKREAKKKKRMSAHAQIPNELWKLPRRASTTTPGTATATSVSSNTQSEKAYDLIPMQMTPPTNRRAPDDAAYERVPDAIKLAVKTQSIAAVNSSTVPISVAQAHEAGYCDVPLESITSNFGTHNNNNNASSQSADNRRPSAGESPYVAAPPALRSTPSATTSSSGGYASAGVVAALAASRRYQAGPASLAPKSAAPVTRLSEIASVSALLAALNAHATLGASNKNDDNNDDDDDGDDASDIDALVALPQATLLELLWAAFESNAMSATRGIYRLVTLARSSQRLTACLPQLLLGGDKSTCAAELGAKCRAIEPLVAVVGVAAQQDLFARVADVLSSASVLSFASERVVGVALRALKVESPRLFASVWLKVSTDMRKRIQQLIEAHSKVLYDRTLKRLLCFDDEPSTQPAPAAPPQLQRQSTSLMLTDQHAKMLARVAHFSPQQLSAALRRNVLLAESGTHSDDDDDEDIDADANPYDRAPPDLRRSAAAPAVAAPVRRTSVLELALLDIDSTTTTTTTTSSGSGAAYTPISYASGRVWTANEVRAAGDSNATLENDDEMFAQVRQLRARLRSELQEVSADEFAAMPSSVPLTRIFQLHVVDAPVDVVALVERLREASTRGGTQFARMCGDALRALSLSDLDAIVSELEPNDAKWLLDMAGTETRRALHNRRRE